MEENKVAQITKHTDSSRSTDSGVSGNAQTSAREIRAREWIAANYDNWFSARKAACKTMYGHEPVVELLAEYAESECSRLASRVEELELIIRELDAAIGVCFDEQDFGSTARGRVILARQQVASVLAGAHAEEKE